MVYINYLDLTASSSRSQARSVALKIIGDSTTR